MEKLTLEETIKHAKEVAKTNRAEATYNFPELKEYYDNCSECANQHNQLAEWLEELKSYKDIGTPKELKELKENWEMYFSNEPVALDNIHNSKTAKIVTPDATICIQPDKIALIELKEINGVPSLVIPVNGELKINGIEVELR